MHRRGIALITVLMAAAVLAMLTTSLVLLARTSLVTGGQFDRRISANEVAYSGLDYARARLAQIPDWSNMVNAVPCPSSASLTVTETGTSTADYLVKGDMGPDGGQFTLQVLNNLRGLTTLPAPPWSRSAITIQPHSALVRVDATYQGASRSIESLLVRRSLLSNAVYAGGDVAIYVPKQGGQLRVSSVIPRGDSIKANNNVYIYGQDRTLFSSNKGNVQAGGDITVNATLLNFDATGNPLNTAGTNLNGNSLATSAASTQMHATLTTGATIPPPKFQPGKLRPPSSAAGVLPAGTYEFLSANQVKFTPSGGGSSSIIDDKINLGTTSVSLLDYRFEAHGNVTVNGDLKLLGSFQPKVWDDADGWLDVGDRVDMPVSLGLGYTPQGVPTGASGSPDRLTVAGNVSIRGDLVGSGQLFAEKSALGGGVLEADSNSLMSSTRTNGMAIVAETSVNLSKVASNTNMAPVTMASNDAAYFLSALTSISADVIPKQVLADFDHSGPSDIGDTAGDSDLPGPDGARAQVIGAGGTYIVNMDGDPNKNLPGYVGPSGSNFMPPHFRSPGGSNLNSIKVGDIDNDGVTDSAQKVLNDYMAQVATHSGLTLGDHMRIREFLKSVDNGSPRPDLLFPPNPTAAGEISEYIKGLVANQIGAYCQDARIKGLPVLSHLSASFSSYNAGATSSVNFEGILYSMGNIFATVTSEFRLAGAVISQSGTISLNKICNGSVVFDPTACEDQFDLARLGVGPIFFWSN